MFHFNYSVVPSYRKKKEALCISKLERKKERKHKARQGGKTISVIWEIPIDIIIKLHICFSHGQSFQSRASSFVILFVFLKTLGVSTKGSFWPLYELYKAPL